MWKPNRMLIKCAIDITQSSKTTWSFWFLMFDLNHDLNHWFKTNDLNQSTLAHTISEIWPNRKKATAPMLQQIGNDDTGSSQEDRTLMPTYIYQWRGNWSNPQSWQLPVLKFRGIPTTVNVIARSTVKQWG